MLCYAMLCYAMLCYAMLCYAMLCVQPVRTDGLSHVFQLFPIHSSLHYPWAQKLAAFTLMVQARLHACSSGVAFLIRPKVLQAFFGI